MPSSTGAWGIGNGALNSELAVYGREKRTGVAEITHLVPFQTRAAGGVWVRRRGVSPDGSRYASRR